MLTVRLTSNTLETMALNNTLETLTLGSTYYINFFTFGENFCSNSFTQSFFNREIAEFFYETLCGSLCFREVICIGFCSVLFFLVAECELQGIVTV